MTRQESRLLWLSEGDAPTCFFHAHANSHRHKNHIHSLTHEGRVLIAEADKVEVAFHFYDTLLAVLASRSNTVKLDLLGIPQADLRELGACFTEDEIWVVIRDLPLDKVPGPDGFTTRFL
jgi:hypothetical protein